jgi:UDP-N-acetylglucosamine acyltransferase
MSIHPTAIVDPTATIADGVEIGPYAIVGARVCLSEGVTIGAHAIVSGPTELGEGCQVYPHAVIGGDAQDKKFRGEEAFLKVGRRNIFREFTTINRGTDGGSTSIGDDNLFMAYAHVAHDAVIGNHCVFANSANIAGHVHIEDNVVLGGLVGVHQYCRIGRCAMVGGGGMAAQDVPPFTIGQGDRARLFGLNIVGLRRNGFSLEVVNALKGAYRELFHQGLPLRIALEQVREVYAEVPEVTELVAFIEASTRGICRSAGTDPAANA